MLTRRRNDWGEDRVVFFDTHGKLRSIRTSWTSLAEPDLYARASAGRSWFRIDDLPLSRLSQVNEGIATQMIGGHLRMGLA